MVTTVRDGGLITKDPQSIQTYTFDWGAENLAAGVTIASQSITIRAVRPSTSDTALLASTSGTGLGIVGSSRQVAVQLTAGTLGQLYEVTSRITSDETPAQTKERSIRVLIEHL